MVIRAKTKMLFEGKPLTEKQKKNTESDWMNMNCRCYTNCLKA